MIGFRAAFQKKKEMRSWGSAVHENNQWEGLESGLKKREGSGFLRSRFRIIWGPEGPGGCSKVTEGMGDLIKSTDPFSEFGGSLTSPTRPYTRDLGTAPRELHLCLFQECPSPYHVHTTLNSTQVHSCRFQFTLFSGHIRGILPEPTCC